MEIDCVISEFESELHHVECRCWNWNWDIFLLTMLHTYVSNSGISTLPPPLDLPACIKPSTNACPSPLLRDVGLFPSCSPLGSVTLDTHSHTPPLQRDVGWFVHDCWRIWDDWKGIQEVGSRCVIKGTTMNDGSFCLTSFFTLLILPQPDASSENQGDKTAPIDNYSLNDDKSSPTITTSTRWVQPTTTMTTLMDVVQWQQWQVRLATGTGWWFSLWARMKCLQLQPNATCQAHPISSPNHPVIPALHKQSSFIVSPTWCWCGESLSPAPSKPCPALPLPSMSLGSL